MKTNEYIIGISRQRAHTSYVRRRRLSLAVLIKKTQGCAPTSNNIDISVIFQAQQLNKYCVRINNPKCVFFIRKVYETHSLVICDITHV